MIEAIGSRHNLYTFIKPARNKNDYESIMAETEKGKPILFLMKRGIQTFYVSINLY
jgi:hypothetical protein